MDIIVGDRYHVKVVAVKERLVVVEFEDSSTSIIHISKIANCFVKDINDFIAVGDELIAEAIKSDEKPFELSLKHLNLKPKHKPKKSEPKDYFEYKQQDRLNQSFDRKKSDKLEQMISSSNEAYMEKERSNSRNRRMNKRKHKGRDSRRYDFD